MVAFVHAHDLSLELQVSEIKNKKLLPHLLTQIANNFQRTRANNDATIYYSESSFFKAFRDLKNADRTHDEPMDLVTPISELRVTAKKWEMRLH